jgi:hypothetical protein
MLIGAAFALLLPACLTPAEQATVPVPDPAADAAVEAAGDALPAEGEAAAEAPAEGEDAAAEEEPAQGGVPEGMRVEPPSFKLLPGAGVKLSGTVAYAGSQKGQLRVEILQDRGEGNDPLLVSALDLDKPGPWSIRAPKNYGKILVIAYVDSDMNGPRPGEAMGDYPGAVTVGAVDIAGLDVTVLDSVPAPTSPPGATPPAASGGAAATAPGAATAPAATAPGAATAPAAAKGAEGAAKGAEGAASQ